MPLIVAGVCALLLTVAVIYATSQNNLSTPIAVTTSVPDPTSQEGVINLNISGLLAKKVEGGILTRGIWSPDEEGVFTSIPESRDFHQIRDAEGAPTRYYRAGDDIYMFTGKAENKDGQELPTPVQVLGVDADTFVPGISHTLITVAKDASQVYVDGMSDPTIDPDTLAVFDDSSIYFKDKNHVYRLAYGIEGGSYKITPFDSATVRLLTPVQSEWWDDPDYIADKNGVYLNEEKIAGADSTSFEVLTDDLEKMKGELEYRYARDARTVFFSGEPVVGANPATFRPLENGEYAHSYGTDGKTVFMYTDPLPDADPKTFEILWQTVYEGCAPKGYSRDAAHVYYATTTISNADPTTFEALIGRYGKDKNGYYRGAEFIGPTLDPKELECNYG